MHACMPHPAWYPKTPHLPSTSSRSTLATRSACPCLWTCCVTSWPQRSASRARHYHPGDSRRPCSPSGSRASAHQPHSPRRRACRDEGGATAYSPQPTSGSRASAHQPHSPRRRACRDKGGAGDKGAGCASAGAYGVLQLDLNLDVDLVCLRRVWCVRDGSGVFEMGLDLDLVCLRWIWTWILRV